MRVASFDVAYLARWRGITRWRLEIQMYAYGVVLSEETKFRRSRIVEARRDEFLPFKNNRSLDQILQKPFLLRILAGCVTVVMKNTSNKTLVLSVTDSKHPKKSEMIEYLEDVFATGFFLVLAGA